MKSRIGVVVLALFVVIPAVAAPRPLLIQTPTVSATQIAFAWAGQIWIVGRDGGEARRLVAGSSRESHPLFSPDGSMVAFSGDYDGNVDVYVVPSAGGQPRRLTYHPGTDLVAAWTPDGKRIAFTSTRRSQNDPAQLYTVPVTGGAPAEVPLARAEEASYSPDGTRLAYEPNFQWQPAWKDYRGGQTRTIWIANLADSSVVKVPQEKNSNDSNPMWVGDKVYFLSDRTGSIALYAYDVATRATNAVIPNSGVDFSSASAGGGAIVYSQFGVLHLFDPATGKDRRIDVTIDADLPQFRPHFEKVDPASGIENAAISPTGKRAVFESRGEIVTVPAEKGDFRNLTHSPGVADRDPAWSPDGKWIAFFSDESGEYALHLADQSGTGDVKKIALGNPPSYFYRPLWSPDSKQIAFSDKRLNLWIADVATGKITRVDTDRFDSPAHEFDPAWSGDSKWLAYTKQLPSQQHAVFIYSVPNAKATQLTDGTSDALYPQFDRNGKYLYFTASTDVGLGAAWLDMSSIGRPQSRAVYAAVLRKDLPSPVPLESDEEKVAEESKPSAADSSKAAAKPDDKTAAKGDEKVTKQPPAAPVTIDFENLGQRIVSLPIPPQNYGGLFAGKEGQLFLAQFPLVTVGGDSPKFDIVRFDLEKRKVEPLAKGLSQFALSSDGEKMLVHSGKSWAIHGTDKAASGDEGALDVASMQIYVDPPAEWRQMYDEVWRIERDFLYDAHFHGLDLAAAKKAYHPYLAGVGSRDDLTYLFEEMTGNISVGHTFVRRGDRPPVDTVSVGLLGADYSIENGRYRITHVIKGENWNPELRAPLTEPGVEVHEGDYLLAVNGVDVQGSNDVNSYFQGTAGVQTSIRVGPSPDGAGARNVTVVPIDSERRLRKLAWVDANRRKVDELSGGRLAYVYLPDTAEGGYTNFNRYYFSQVGKQGAVIDERFNHGGDLADYIVDYLGRKPMSRVMGREGEDYTEPISAIFGPKVMIINQFSGSGGDALPWYFRKAGVGTLVGMRTWGGLVGIGNYPTLIDGGSITAPRWAIYGLTGQWEVENQGIPPDVEVEQDPKLVREGHDPQLERAVAVALDELKTHPPETFPRPAYPVYKHPLPGAQ
ncbi:MAG TPA: PDZ domain-containing protein [Thermoanaerobaculia bacterium]|jgi:tricorn protease